MSNAVEMTPVNSSQIAKVGYDELHADLYVEFQPKKDGTSSTYVYRSVPKQMHRDLMDAPSLGVFFNANIKPNFQFEKLP